MRNLLRYVKFSWTLLYWLQNSLWQLLKWLKLLLIKPVKQRSRKALFEIWKGYIIMAITVVEFHTRGYKIQDFCLKVKDSLIGAHISMFFISNALVVIEEIKIQGAVLELNNTGNSAHLSMKLGQIAANGSAFSW